MSFSQTADEYYKMAQKETEFKNLKLEFLNQALEANPKHFLARFERAGLLIPIDSLKAITDINTLIKQNPKVDSLLAYRAIFYKLLKNYPLSINDLNLYLSKHPNSFDGLNHRAECYFGLRQYAKAIQDLDKAFLFANSNSQKALVYQSKGDISFAKKDTTESIAYWEKSLTFVENVEQLETIASTLKEQGKYQLALQKINRLLVLKPNESKFWMEKAAIESFDKVINYQSMVQSIRKALEIEPGCIYCLKILKSIQTLTNQDDEVIQTMEKLAVLDPDSAGVIRTAILNLKIKLKRYNEVFNDFDLAIKKDSVNKKAYLFNKIKIKRDIGKPNDALSDVEILIQDYPNETEYQIFKNTLLIEANRLDDAIEDCDKQLMSHQNNFLIYGNRGMTYGKLKKWKKANDDINKAIQLAKIQKADNSIVAELFGLKFDVKINQKDTLEALLAINEAISLSPEVKFLNVRGGIYFLQKNYKEAIEDYKKIVEQTPNDFTYISSLCNFYIQNNEKNTALDLASEAIQRNTTDGNFYLLRAIINIDHLFDYKPALYDIEKAISFNNCIDTVGLYRVNGIALRQLGKYKEALISFNKAIALDSLNAELYNYRGVCYNITSDEINFAINDYKKAIAINPKYAPTYLNLGKVNLNNAKSLKEKEEAILLIDKFLSLTATENPVSVTRIEALLVKSSYFVEKDIALCVKLANQVEELLLNGVDSNSWLYSEFYTLKARLANQQDKKNMAKDWALKAIQCKNFNNDTKRSSFFMLALLAEEEDKINETCMYADSMLNISDKSSQLYKDEILLYKGSVLGKYLEFEKAKKVVEGVTPNKDNKCVWNLVHGLISSKERTYQKAIGYFNTSLEAFDTYVPILFNIPKDQIYEYRGDAYLKYQYYEDAISDYDKALKINPKNKEAITGKKKAQDGLDGKLPLIATSQEINEKPSEIKEVFPAYPKRVALVVGNSNYAHATKLDQKPINDAEDIGKRLKDLGFDVIMVLDATYEDLRKAVNTWSKKIVGADIALLFYGGHGLEEDGKNYLLPIDAQIENAEDISGQGYPLNQLVEMLDKNNPTFSVLILDACRNNPFKGTKNRSIGDNNSRGFKNVEVKKGSNNRFVAMATAPTTVAQQGGRNGVYTSALLKHLQKGIRLEDVFLKVRQEVIEQTNKAQIPEQSSSMNKTFAF